MPKWEDVPKEIKKRFPSPPEREKYPTANEYEEALGFWHSRVGRNLGLVMQQYEASLPTSAEYTVGNSSSNRPCVVIKSQKVAWNGRTVGDSKEQILSIEDVEQLVGFCLRCGNQELIKAVRRPVFAMTHGPDHPFSKE